MLRVYLILALVGLSLGNDYCKLCSDHTLCKYDGKINSKNCENTIEGNMKYGVDDEDKKFIVNEHNKWRRIIAKGEDDRIGMKSAADMMEMEWDDELAKIAQAWANQCTWSHDKCRTPLTNSINDRCFKSGGQNNYINTGTMPYWKSAIWAWYIEIKDYHRDSVDEFKSVMGIGQKSNKVIGHFTQLIWAKTWKVGCGFTAYKAVKPFNRFGPRGIYICNYAPGGNYKTKEVYKTGTPCSACPENAKCNDGLCKLNA